MKTRFNILTLMCVLGMNGGHLLRAEPDLPWPVFRGNAALTGVAGGVLSTPLKLRWSFLADDGISSSPVVGYGKVFFGSDDGTIYAVAIPDGQKSWSFDTADMVEAPPFLHGKTLFVGAMNGILYALNADDGTEKWRFETGARIVGSANAVRVAGRDLIVVGSHDCSVYALDASTGETVWTHVSESFINGAPAVYKEQVIVGGCDARLHVLSAASGKGFAVDAGSYIAGSAAVSRDHAFVGHYGNQLVSIDLRERSIAWAFGSVENGAPFFSSPAVDDQYVLAGCRDDYLYCIDRETAVQKWRFETGGRVDGGPVICDGKVVVGSEDGVLYVLALAEGNLLWSFDVGRPIATSPAVVGGSIFVGAEDGRMYAFGPEGSVK